MAGATGLEPATFGVTGRQIQLRNQRPFKLFRTLKTLSRNTEVGVSIATAPGRRDDDRDRASS